ncbi:transposase [Lactococcus petauri]|uniref:transposase n=1 Tax=Lactococcus petauri TaxID=1940789 RepID=UPI002549DEAB|nr:transposase [Lactococcus petauri]
MAKGKYEEWLTTEGLILLEGWARDGLTDEQIALNIGIGTTTLYRWKKDYREIRESLKKGKEVVDIQVENALLKRALGYEFVEITKELTDAGLLVTKEVTKQQAPDTTAAIFWLKNRKTNEWRDRKETQLSGEVSVSNPYEGLTEEELRKLASRDG